MEILNNPDKTPSAEPSLKRNIVPDAKNTKKLMDPPWRPQLNLLCWSHHPLLRLKEFGIKSAFVKIFSSTLRSLYPGEPSFKHYPAFWIAAIR
jgi:hypothetical protein